MTLDEFRTRMERAGWISAGLGYWRMPWPFDRVSAASPLVLRRGKPIPMPPADRWRWFEKRLREMRAERTRKLVDALMFEAGMDWAVGGDLGFAEGLVVEGPGGERYLWLFESWTGECVPGARSEPAACRAGHRRWASDVRGRFPGVEVGWVPGDGDPVYGVSWALVALPRETEEPATLRVREGRDRWTIEEVAG